MKRYCGKCGAEISENTIFCSKCGTSVENTVKITDNRKKQTISGQPQVKRGVEEQRKMTKNKSKKPMIIIGVAITIVVIVIAVLAVVLIKSAEKDYEKPLKLQVEGLKKGDKDKYAESFTVKGKEYFLDGLSDEEFKESARKYENVSYEVKNISEGDTYDVWDDYNIRMYQMTESEKKTWYSCIEEIKVVTVNVSWTNEGEQFEEKMDYRMIKVNGKWCTIDSIM